MDRSGWGTNLAFFDSEGCMKGAQRGGMDGRHGGVCEWAGWHDQERDGTR